MQTTIGRRLAAIRNSRGLTQDELAAAVGKTRGSIGHLEAGRVADVGVLVLCRIADALGCGLRDLLAPVGAPIPPLRPERRRRRGATASKSQEPAKAAILFRQ
jgi:transcriptional regulator with XRE-family HTH domain